MGMAEFYAPHQRVSSVFAALGASQSTHKARVLGALIAGATILACSGCGIASARWTTLPLAALDDPTSTPGDGALLGSPLSPAPATAPSTAQGGLSRGEIHTVVQNALPAIQKCYETALLKSSVRGKVVTRWTIGGTGDVVHAEIKESELKDSETEGCILAIIQKLRFPKPKGGGNVLVTHPFVFSWSDDPSQDPAAPQRGVCGFL